MTVNWHHRGKWAHLSGIYLADNWSGTALPTVGTPILGRWEPWLHEKCSWTRASEARQSAVFLSPSLPLHSCLTSQVLNCDLICLHDQINPFLPKLAWIVFYQINREKTRSMTIHITVLHKTMLESHREVEPGVMYNTLLTNDKMLPVLTTLMSFDYLVILFFLIYDRVNSLCNLEWKLRTEKLYVLYMSSLQISWVLCTQRPLNEFLLRFE